MLGRAGALLGPKSQGVPPPPAQAGGLLLPSVCSGLMSLGWRRLHKGCSVPSAAPSFARHHGLSGAGPTVWCQGVWEQCAIGGAVAPCPHGRDTPGAALGSVTLAVTEIYLPRGSGTSQFIRVPAWTR